jgi:hypothetical protein
VTTHDWIVWIIEITVGVTCDGNAKLPKERDSLKEIKHPKFSMI